MGVIEMIGKTLKVTENHVEITNQIKEVKYDNSEIDFIFLQDVNTGKTVIVNVNQILTIKEV